MSGTSLVTLLTLALTTSFVACDDDPRASTATDTAASHPDTTSEPDAGAHPDTDAALDTDPPEPDAPTCLGGICDQPPVASLACPDRAAIDAPLTLDASASHDPEGAIVDFAFEPGDLREAIHVDDGTLELTYAGPGRYTARVTVTDAAGQRASASCDVVVWGPVGVPTGLTVVAGDESADLAWDEVPGALEYQIEHAPLFGEPLITFLLATPVEGRVGTTLIELDNRVWHTFKVRALNPLFTSDFGPSVEARPNVARDLAVPFADVQALPRCPMGAVTCDGFDLTATYWLRNEGTEPIAGCVAVDVWVGSEATTAPLVTDEACAPLAPGEHVARTARVASSLLPDAGEALVRVRALDPNPDNDGGPTTWIRPACACP